MHNDTIKPWGGEFYKQCVLYPGITASLTSSPLLHTRKKTPAVMCEFLVALSRGPDNKIPRDIHLLSARAGHSISDHFCKNHLLHFTFGGGFFKFAQRSWDRL